jgi:pyruvate dehydrogenase E1 component
VLRKHQRSRGAVLVGERGDFVQRPRSTDDPTYAYELAVIVDHGMRGMMERQLDEFYYITVMNENYAQPSMPSGVGADIVKGMYRLGGQGALDTECRVRLLGSGCILREVIAAAQIQQPSGLA